MSEIPKAYEPQSVESKWYQYWLNQNFFVADPARVSEKRPAYSIVIPPPNVTGVLTMGHVLNNTIQDILARKARMDGKEVLWQPGIDHAGIATEGVVSRQLRKEEHKTKQDLGREEFLKRVWQWKEKHGGIILQQLKALGASCDWARTRFTMDDDYVRCVMKVFVDLYKKGLIYRGKRMVNWCPASLTALSDEEVVMKEQKGFMYHFKVEVVESIPLGRSRGDETHSNSERGTRNVEQSQSLLTSAATEGEKKAVGPITDSDGRTWLTIATTRPETIPGDTAVAVNPKDPRYARLIGKHVVRPLPPELRREQKLIPIIGDEHVDFEFGTGVLKVTPAHDKADFEIWARTRLHGITQNIDELRNMQPIEVIAADGKMNALAGRDLNGLDRFAARKVATEKLRELGSLEKEEPYTNNVGYSERADVAIEPRLSEQWFLKYPSVEQARACVAQPGGSGEGGTGYQPVPAGNLPTGPETPGRLPGATGQWPVPSGGKMRFFPDRWAKVYDHWMGGIQDWCISRQLWWGHRIPVWSIRFTATNFRQQSRSVISTVESICALAGTGTPDGMLAAFISTTRKLDEPPLSSEGMTVSSAQDPEQEISYRLHRFANGNEFELHALTSATESARELEAAGFTQDPDVLDTWFSSWLWPFATMGWTGDKTQDSNNPTLRAFYPTTDLVTGPDIIFFWVARMIMAGYEYMGDLPFRNVYFTGIIRDKQGRKMSKSLGNSPDPLDLIAKYGADALRFGVMRAAPLGQDILFDEENVELGRNFCNKLWNACRFRQMQGGQVQGEIDTSKLRSDDKWILLKLHAAIKELNASFAEYKFNEATATLYRFFWTEYCDWYVESCKAVLTRATDGASPSPLGGDRAGVRGETGQSVVAEASASPHPSPLPPVRRGGEGEEARIAAMKANVLAVIDFVLSHTLRLFHPFLPFVTEELWHGMGYATDMPEGQGGKTIMHAPWPKPFDADFRDFYALDDCYLDFVNRKFELVTQGRNLRREANVPANKKVKFILKPVQDLPPNDIEVIKLLLNAETLDLDPDYEPQKGVLSVKAELGVLCLPLEELVDATAEIARLTKEIEKYNSEIAKVEGKLANPNFTQKVPPNVLAEHQKRLADWLAKRDHAQSALDRLKQE